MAEPKKNDLYRYKTNKEKRLGILEKIFLYIVVVFSPLLIVMAIGEIAEEGPEFGNVGAVAILVLVGLGSFSSLRKDRKKKKLAKKLNTEIKDDIEKWAEGEVDGTLEKAVDIFREYYNVDIDYTYDEIDDKEEVNIKLLELYNVTNTLETVSIHHLNWNLSREGTNPIRDHFFYLYSTKKDKKLRENSQFILYSNQIKYPFIPIKNLGQKDYSYRQIITPLSPDNYASALQDNNAIDDGTLSIRVYLEDGPETVSMQYQKKDRKKLIYGLWAAHLIGKKKEAFFHESNSKVFAEEVDPKLFNGTTPEENVAKIQELSKMRTSEYYDKRIDEAHIRMENATIEDLKEKKGKDAVQLLKELINNAMVYIEGGEFQMGTDDVEKYQKHFTSVASPSHTVSLSDFYISKYVVGGSLKANQKEYKDDEFYFLNYVPALAGFHRDIYTWYDAVNLCNVLSEMTGLDRVYTINGTDVEADHKKNGFRLPTEAEWEYAAQKSNAGEEDKPKKLEFYMDDEWCWDWYDESYYANSPKDNPAGPSKGEKKVVREGDIFNLRPEDLKYICRAHKMPYLENPKKDGSRGSVFRLVSRKLP